ncbi:sugar ABC transporter substrate-binding protein [Nocardiopsis oceani]
MTRNTLGALGAGAALLLATGCGSGYDDDGGGELTLMFGSSGEAETAAVQEAVAAWSDESGTPAEAVPAHDLDQQLVQGFSGGNPPDVFYLGPDQVGQFAEGGSLYAYGDQVEDADDFHPALLDTYTLDDELYCLPKDHNSHALVIDTQAWEEAGLGDDDVPTTWEELEETADELSGDGRVGLALSGEYHAVGTFMQQAGGWFLDDDGEEVTADAPENLTALEYLDGNIDDGNFAFVTDIGAQSGSEALGMGDAAMIIDGGWVAGGFDNDYPDLEWQAVAAPAGPDGEATTVFSNCWGVAEASGLHDEAVDLVEYLTSADQQQAFAEAFGVAPSRASLADWTAEQFPHMSAFHSGVDVARGPVPEPGFGSVMREFDTNLQGMVAGTATPEQVLDRLQADGEAALAQE